MYRQILPIAALAALAAAPAAHAQSGAEFNAGYGRAPGQENRAMAQSTIRDAAGNLLIVDGVIQTVNGRPANYSSNTSGVGSNADAYGAQSYSGAGGSGVGAASAVAIGNQLNVVTSGNYNTVIVNNNQTNNGAISAGAVGNGGSSGN